MTTTYRITASASASAAAEAAALSVDVGLPLNSALISAYVGSFPGIRATVVMYETKSKMSSSYTKNDSVNSAFSFCSVARQLPCRM
jgi:hypothetical protein